LSSSRPAASTLALLAFAQLIIALDLNIVFVALPEIADDVGFTDQTLQWVVSAYAVAFGGFLVLGGRCADLLGRRRVFVLALLLYAGSSFVGGLAGSPEVLIAVRAVQGLGGALLFPATLSLVTTLFAEGRERNRALAAWSGAGASGLCLGALLGGVLTNAFGWEATFLVNVPLAGGAALFAFRLIPRDGARERGRAFDVPGALTATGAITVFVFALVQAPEAGWTSAVVLAGAALAVILGAAFVAVEARSREPLMPPRLWRNRSLRSAMAITFVFGTTFMSVPYFLTSYFQVLQGYSALETGLAFLLPAAMIALGTQLGGRLTTHAGGRATLIGGTLLGAAGTVVIAWALDGRATYAELVPGFVMWGMGQGITWTAMWIVSASGVAAREQGVASGMASTALQVGTATGLAVLVAVANAGTDGLAGAALRDERGDGVATATYVAAAGILAAAAVAAGARRLSGFARMEAGPAPATARE
jgi:EmrB/QacA subfamily drug resistance transporter